MSLTKREIEKIRGHLMVEGWPGRKLAVKFGVSRSMVSQVITGNAISKRIQDFIAEEIGYWPWNRKKGEPRPE